MTSKSDLNTIDLSAGLIHYLDTGGRGPSVPLDSGRSWSAGLASFDKPALVVWAPEDQMMPPEHGHRLADLLPQGQLVEITDNYTVVPLDQPQQLADAVRVFVTSTANHLG
jgi:pimeloyl-ACP methyl ester carboxylesterase